MTANGKARFGNDFPEHSTKIQPFQVDNEKPADCDFAVREMSEAEKALCEELNSEFSTSLVQPPETTSPNRPNWTYRGRFMAGKELEYEATLEAYEEIYQGKHSQHISALKECRTYAHFKRDAVSGDVKVFGDSCRDRWCPMCAGQKAAYAKDQTEVYVKSLTAPRFLTLTLRHNESTLREQISFLQQSFSRLRTRAYWKRNVTGGIWFLQVKRGKNSGLWHPHLHILLDGNYMEQERLSALWELVTYGSPVIDIRRVHDIEAAASYVSRYTARPAVLNDMPLFDRVEVIEALFKKRLCGTFGNAKAITLTPPKIAGGEDWQYVGHYDDIVEKAETDPAAKAILVAYNTYQPLSEKAFEDFTGHPPGYISKMSKPKEKDPQLLLDFYNS